MFKLLNKKRKDNKGFTLVELVIVVAILAILVGLLAPQYTKYVEKSRKSADVDNMDEMVKAVQVYAVDHAINTDKNSTAAVTATITLGDSKVEIGDTADKAVENALKEYVPNYEKVSVKSKKWSENPKATITIDTDGGVKVKLEPEDFEKYAEKSSSSVNPTPTTGGQG